MTNTLLTPTQVTRKALDILHQKLNFVGTITRGYDESFAKEGAKIGDTLKIRLPNEYKVRTGATLSTQDTAEQSVNLQVATQKGVDLNFTSADLTLSLDDFSGRILEPAMAVLAAAIESDALSMYQQVYQQVNNHGLPLIFAKALLARKRLVDSLAPPAGRQMLMNTQDNVDMVDALKGLFNDQTNLGKQYRDGYLGRTAGFDWNESTLIPNHTPGTLAGTPLINGGSQVSTDPKSMSLVTDGWTNSTAAVKAGDVFTISSVFEVHPETKVSTGRLQQFVCLADGTADGSGNLTLSVAPGIISSNTSGYQNVSATPADNAPLTFVGTASTASGLSLAYTKDAFALATADLVMPKGVDFSAREVFDGISMRIVRQYDINNDKFPCRLDILYGFKAVRPKLACRVASN